MQSGQVVQVSRSPLPASELAALAQAPGGSVAGEALYRITVALDRQAVAPMARTSRSRPACSSRPTCCWTAAA